MGDAAERKPLRDQELSDVMSGRLTFDGGISRKDRLAEIAFSHPHEQFRNADRFGTQAIERRQVPLEHEVAAAKTRLLNGKDVDRALNDTEQRVVPAGIGALQAKLILGKRTTLTAIAHLLHRSRKRLSQPQPTAAVTLEHLQRHALGGLLAYTGKNPQCVDELANKRTERHEFTGARLERNESMREGMH